MAHLYIYNSSPKVRFYPGCPTLHLPLSFWTIIRGWWQGIKDYQHAYSLSLPLFKCTTSVVTFILNFEHIYEFLAILHFVTPDALLQLDTY